MDAALAMHDGPRPEVQLLRDFSWIDMHGVHGRTAEVEYRLGTGQMMSLAAGGSGVKSSPGSPPFLTYEVIFSEDPPRFWRRYTDSAGMVYANVPRTLLTHYVVRSGGILWRSERIVEPKGPALPFLPQGACFRW